jgi:predicted nucleic acid-binding protein
VLVTSRVRELLVADTSFVSQQRLVATRPEATSTWPIDVVRRVDRAVIAISVVTLAEERCGHWLARWGERRRAQADRWLLQFMQLPVNGPVADAWARLKAAGQYAGRSFGANDLWIAATGYAREAPIVTCDRDFLHMRELGVEVIYLPSRPDSVASATG